MINNMIDYREKIAEELRGRNLPFAEQRTYLTDLIYKTTDRIEEDSNERDKLMAEIMDDDYVPSGDERDIIAQKELTDDEYELIRLDCKLYLAEMRNMEQISPRLKSLNEGITRSLEEQEVAFTMLNELNEGGIM